MAPGNKAKTFTGSSLSKRKWKSALTDVYFNEIDARLKEELMGLTSVEKAFDPDLFFSVCALSERMFYSRLVTKDMSEVLRKTMGGNRRLLHTVGNLKDVTLSDL